MNITRKPCIKITSTLIDIFEGANNDKNPLMYIPKIQFCWGA